MRFFLIITICLVSNLGVAQENHSPLWTNLDEGPYDVGFQVQFLVDSTRIMVSTDSLPHAIKGRPLRVKLYYPGEKMPSSTLMSFSEQIDIYPQNPQFATYNTILSHRDHRLQGQFSPASDSLEKVLFKTTTMAYSNIPFANGAFPLLIYELGLDDHQMENSVLWEYLASHGYIVAVLPSFGFDLENKYVPYTSEGALELYRDALFTLNSLKDKPFVNRDKIGAIGHSFGGIVANLLASRQSIVKAVAALDGSFNNPEQAQIILKELAINSSTINVPLLNLYTKAHPKDLTFVESLGSPLYQFGFYDASHYDFQNFPLYAFITNTSDRRVDRRRSTNEGKEIHTAMVQLTKHFLDFILMEDEGAEAFLIGETSESQKFTSFGEFEN